MSTKIKLYNQASDGNLYVGRFPATLDLKTAFAKGWIYPATAQKLYPGKDIKAIAIMISIPKLNPAPSAASSLTKDSLDEFNKAKQQLQSSELFNGDKSRIIVP